VTRQISDRVFYNGKSYLLVAAAPGTVFDPREHGLQPAMISTACVSGFWCEFAVEGDRLLLHRLHIHTEDGVYPRFNGVAPLLPLEDGELPPLLLEFIMGLVTYQADLPLSFSGRLLLGDGYGDDLHPGPLLPWGFAHLLELVFDGGALTEVNDLSEDAALARRLREAEDKTVSAAVRGLTERCWWLRQ